MAAKKSDKPTEVVSIKGFDHEFKCRGMQLEVGKTYTVTGKIKACENGFHAVSTDSPFHVWDFYPVVDDQGRLSRYAEVTQSGDMDSEKVEGGTKIASASLTVNVELSLSEFIKRAVSWIVDATKGKDNGSSGDGAQIGSSGDGAQIVAEGAKAVIACAGRNATVTGAGGAWISIAEYNDAGDCIGFASGCIGKDGLKAGVPYVAKGGKLVEAV